jgi:hypothetical protein
VLPQPFATRENRSYPEFWAITDNPRYPGYFTSTILLFPIRGLIKSVVRSIFNGIVRGGRKNSSSYFLFFEVTQNEVSKDYFQPLFNKIRCENYSN